MGIYVKKWPNSLMSSLSLVQLTNLSIRVVVRIMIHPLPSWSCSNRCTRLYPVMIVPTSVFHLCSYKLAIFEEFWEHLCSERGRRPSYSLRSVSITWPSKAEEFSMGTALFSDFIRNVGNRMEEDGLLNRVPVCERSSYRSIYKKMPFLSSDLRSRDRYLINISNWNRSVFYVLGRF